MSDELDRLVAEGKAMLGEGAGASTGQGKSLDDLVREGEAMLAEGATRGIGRVFAETVRPYVAPVLKDVAPTEAEARASARARETSGLVSSFFKGLGVPQVSPRREHVAPPPPQAQPVRVGGEPGFTLPGEAPTKTGLPRVYGRSFEEAVEVSEELPAEAARLEKQAERKARRAVEPIRAPGVPSALPSPFETVTPEEWRPSFAERTGKGAVALLSWPVTLAAGTAGAVTSLASLVPAALGGDEAARLQLARGVIQPLRATGEFGAAVKEDPWGVLKAMWEEDPVGTTYLFASLGSGGAGATAGVARTVSRFPRLAAAAHKVERAAKTVGKVTAEAGVLPIRAGLSVVPHLPGSLTYEAGKFLAASERVPAGMRSWLRKWWLTPKDVVKTLPAEQRAIFAAVERAPIEARVSLERILGRGGDWNEPIPFQGTTRPKKEVLETLLQAQPRAWRAALTEEARSVAWRDPVTGEVYGGAKGKPLPTDRAIVDRLESTTPIKTPEEFIRKRELAAEFASDKPQAPTLEDYGVEIRFRTPDGKSLRIEELPARKEGLKGLKAEYVRMSDLPPLISKPGENLPALQTEGVGVSRHGPTVLRPTTRIPPIEPVGPGALPQAFTGALAESPKGTLAPPGALPPPRAPIPVMPPPGFSAIEKARMLATGEAGKAGPPTLMPPPPLPRGGEFTMQPPRPAVAPPTPAQRLAGTVVPEVTPAGAAEIPSLKPGMEVRTRVKGVTPGAEPPPKPPHIEDDAWNVLKTVGEPVRNLIDDLSAQVAEGGLVDPKTITRRFGHFLAHLYDWDKLMREDPKLAARMKVVQRKLGARTPDEAEALALRKARQLTAAGEDVDHTMMRLYDMPAEAMSRLKLIRDLHATTRTTVNDLSNMAAQSRLFQELRPFMRGAEAVGEEFVPLKSMTKLRLPKGTEDLSVPRDVADVLRLFEGLHADPALWDKGMSAWAAIPALWDKGMSVWKGVHVIPTGSWPTLVRNMLSGLFWQAPLGRLSAFDPANARVYVQYLAEMVKGRGPLYDEATAALGGGLSIIRDASARKVSAQVLRGLPGTASDLRQAAQDVVTARGMAGRIGSVARLAKEVLWDQPLRLYAANDEALKGIGYSIIRGLQRDFLKGTDAEKVRAMKWARLAWGDEWEQRLRGGPTEAVHHVMETFVDYSNVGGIQKALQRTVWPFGAFTAGTAPFAVKAARDQQLRFLVGKYAADELQRMNSYWSGMKAQDVEQARGVAPAYAGHQVFVGVAEDGKPLFVPVSYISPAGTLFPREREFSDSVLPAMTQDIAFGGPAQQLYDLARGVATTPGSAYWFGTPPITPVAPAGMKAREAVGAAWKVLGPPVATYQLPKLLAAYRGEPLPYTGQIPKFGQTLAGWLSGTKTQEVDVPSQQARLEAMAEGRKRILKGEIARLEATGRPEDLIKAAELEAYEYTIDSELARRSLPPPRVLTR